MIYISEQGEKLLKSKICKNKLKTDENVVSENRTETVSDISGTVSGLISMLEKELNNKNKQLEVKDKQIEELTATIKIQAESINAARHNELAETIIDGQNANLQLAGKKNGFLSRFFRKRER